MTTGSAVPLRTFGRTGLRLSELIFGAGPVSGLMTSTTYSDQQRATVQRALESGINCFDTAPGYGDGKSETNLGKALADLGAPETVHLATKVRLDAAELSHISEAVSRSVRASLRRLRRNRIKLIQLHNSITVRRGDAPTSITPLDVLGPGGVAEAFDDLRKEGVVEHFGLTGLGEAASLREVIKGAPWASIQVNEHALIRRLPEKNDLFDVCARAGVALLAIRVLAGGALAVQPPSAHTLTTRFFPLTIYERDLANAQRLAALLPRTVTLTEFAIRYVLALPVAAAIIGFANSGQVDLAAACAGQGPLPEELLKLRDRLELPEENP